MESNSAGIRSLFIRHAIGFGIFLRPGPPNCPTKQPLLAASASSLVACVLVAFDFGDVLPSIFFLFFSFLLNRPMDEPYAKPLRMIFAFLRSVPLGVCLLLVSVSDYIRRTGLAFFSVLFCNSRFCFYPVHSMITFRPLGCTGGLSHLISIHNATARQTAMNLVITSSARNVF